MKKDITEAKFWSNWVKPALQGIAADHQRLEVSTSRGVPDVNACYRGCEIWMELKVSNKGQCELRKEQYAWGTRRAKQGNGLVYVMFLDLKDQHIDIWQFPFTVAATNGRYVHPSKKDRVVRITLQSLGNYIERLFN